MLHIIVSIPRLKSCSPCKACCHGRMIHKSPHRYPKSRPPTTDKASPATCSAIKIGGQKNPSELCRPETHAKIEWSTLGIQHAGIGDEGHGRKRKRTQDGSRVFAKQQRCRTNADLDVVGLVLRNIVRRSPSVRSANLPGGRRYYHTPTSNIHLPRRGVNRRASRRYPRWQTNRAARPS